MSNHMKKDHLILLLLVLIKFFLQYSLINTEYELHRDEYLHLDQGNHLAWGFLSVPPVNSWLAWVVQTLGASVFWVKFFPALFGALTIVVVWKIVETLNGDLFAKILAATGVLLSILLRLNMLFQPTSLEVLLWTLLYFVLIRYFRSEQAKWLYVAAVIFGIGFLNKYNIVFSVLGLIPALLITQHWKIFLNKHLYFSALLALMIMLPNLIWQFNYNFPVVDHMGELAERQLVHVSRLNFLKSQLLFFVGVLFVWLPGCYALLFYKPFKEIRFLFWAYVFTIVLFVIFRAKDYYAIGLYPTFIAIGAAYLGILFEKSRIKWILKITSLSIPVLLFLPLYNFAFPNKNPKYIVEHPDHYKRWGLLRWEDGKDHSLPQDFADMQGWKELAQKTDQEYIKVSKYGKTLVLCDNYGQAGAINYYSKQNIKAVSFNADYLYWFDLSEKYTNLIRIKEYSEPDELIETGPYFKKAELVDSIVNPFARERGTMIFNFMGAKLDIRDRLKAEIDDAR